MVSAINERQVESEKRLAWLTASLVGFNKVPPYEVVFKKEGRALEARNENDVRAAFTAFGGHVVSK